MPENQSPDTRGKVQEDMAPKIELFRDVLGGTAVMREKGEKYLPKFEVEERDSYQKRLGQAVLYNATELTLDALVGMVFHTEPELAENIPQELMDEAENIDLGGRHLNVFAKDFFRDAWDGLSCIVVDMQRTPQAVRSKRDEQRVGLRPYWTRVLAQDIVRARSATINGKETLVAFAYSETVTVEDGEYGEKHERRIRDFRLDGGVVTYRVHALKVADGGREEWVVIEGPEPLMISAAEPMDEIPVAVCYTNRIGFFASEPPLLDLAHENIDHYQQRSEHRKAWQYARVPIPIFPGMEPDQVVIAADRGICTPSPESQPYYMETEGNSLEGSKEELRESERRMANLGAQMLYRPEKSNETATARRIENAQSNSRLASAARALQDCLEEALRLHAKWKKLELPNKTDGRWISVNMDFDPFELDAQQVAALDAAVSGGHLTLETFLTALRDGVAVLSFLDPEKEAAMLEAAGPAMAVEPAQPLAA